MNRLKKFTGLFTAALLTFSTLTGCSSQDKESVSESATTFLAIVADDSQEDINKYATTDVTNGDFVKLFDADLLTQQFMTDSEGVELSEESKAKLEEFCQLFSDMIQLYSVSDVEIIKGEPYSATCIATIKTSFDVNVISSQEAADKIKAETEKYNTANADEIATLAEEDPDGANNKVYNDMLMLVLDVYENEIANSQETTYAMVLTLEKNSETDSWIVTKIENYDDSNK